MSSGFKLLTASNPKTAKGAKLGYWTFILHLAPASLSGFNVCPMATQGCKAACLNTAGRSGITNSKGLLTYAELSTGNGRTNAIQQCRVKRTRMFFEARESFIELLVHDIARAVRLAEKAGFTPVFRLNGTSDIRWETVPAGGYANIFAVFPTMQFYDYTKIANRKGLPANYKLTFSLADGNDKQALAALQNGMNVAVVFRDKATVARYMGTGYGIHTHPDPVPVYNGDDTDLRFLDPDGHVIALYAKGQARKDTSGFVRG